MADSPIEFDRLRDLGPELRGEFETAKPYPHVVVDDFLPVETARLVLDEFEQTHRGWDHYHHYNEKKRAVSNLELLGPHTRALFDAFQSRRFVKFIEALTGIEPLLSDPDLDGAGLHKIEAGGFLNVHTDFLSHPIHRTWSRQINLLLYLNPSWGPEWNGDLELWDAEMSHCVKSIAPTFNRCVIFHTAEASYHGHPRPLACPTGESRKSIALYYFRDEGSVRRVSSTHYRALPDDPLYKKWLVAADRNLVRAYSVVKRYTGLSNDVVGRILKLF